MKQNLSIPFHFPIYIYVCARVTTLKTYLLMQCDSLGGEPE
jgi:hypothetical protein